MHRPESREDLAAWGLAAVGAVRCLPELISSHPEHNIQSEELGSAIPALLALGGIVTVYDVMAPNKHRKTITAEVHSNLDRHRILTAGAILTLSAHLLRVLPQDIDPLHLGGQYLRSKIYRT